MMVKKTSVSMNIQFNFPFNRHKILLIVIILTHVEFVCTKDTVYTHVHVCARMHGSQIFINVLVNGNQKKKNYINNKKKKFQKWKSVKFLRENKVISTNYASTKVGRKKKEKVQASVCCFPRNQKKKKNLFLLCE